MSREIRLPFVTVQAAIRQLPTMTFSEIRELIPDLRYSVEAMEGVLPGGKPRRRQLEAIEGTRKRKTKPRGNLAAVRGDHDA